MMKDEVVKESHSNLAVKPSLLDAFESLRSPKTDLKASGGAGIISHLEDDESGRNVKYAVKRLVRSLGVNAPEERTGYFATLVNVIKVNEINVSQLLDVVKKELHASGSSKSEVGDVCLGQILVCSAIFRSGLMLKCTEEEHKEIMQLLHTASKKKSYLSTVASLILLDFIDGLDEEQFSSIIWSNIKNEFKKDIKEYTLDSLYFLFVVNKKFASKVKLRKLIGTTEILSEDNIPDICEKLMTGIDFNSLSHPIYQEIGMRIATSPHLILFWTEIDKQLIKHNRNRELVSINILTVVLQNISGNTEVIPELITHNFFRLFLDWFKGLRTASKVRNKRDDEDDHKIMIKKEKDLLNALTKALKSDEVTSKTRVETLKKLLFHPGQMNLTEITGTTVAKSIIADLDISGIKKMAKLFKSVLLNVSKKTLKGDNERGWFNNERTKAAEHISYLVSHDAVKDDIEFKITYMKLLMCFGFFKISGEENVSISSELSAAIKSSFYRCSTSRYSCADNLVTVLSSLSEFITTILGKEEVKTKMEKQFSKENLECWEMLTEICQNIEKVEVQSKVDKVFLILLYQLGLFLFSEPSHIKMARSSIKELKSCYEHYKKGKKKKKLVANDEPEWIEVLVEVLLSILSIESSVLRLIVQCVFRMLWEYLTPSSIGQIVSVLDPESEANPLSQEDSDEEDEDEPEEDEPDDDKESSDEESDENTGDSNVNGKNDDDSDSDGSIEEEDDDDDGNIKIPDQLRMAVQKALGDAADSDTESLDADMIDDEEGKKLDDALAEAFKQFNQGKNKKTKKDRKNKKALADFRIRALDLLDIYLEKDPAMDICLGMIAPLTSCLESCVQDSQFSELENRLRKTIKHLAKIRKFSTQDDVTNDILCDYLKAIINKGARSQFMYQAIGDVVTHFATFIIVCSQKISKSAVVNTPAAPIVEVFKETLESFFTNRNCLLPIIFFHSVLRMQWDGNYDLILIIIKNVADPNVRQYRRNEGLELLVGFYRALNRYKCTSQAAVDKLLAFETSLENMINNQLKKKKMISEVKTNYVATLTKLLNSIRAFHKSSNIKTTLQFQPLLQALESVKRSVKKRNKKNAANEGQVRNNVKPAKNKNGKRQLLSNGSHLEPGSKKAKKKSVSTEETE